MAAGGQVKKKDTFRLLFKKKICIYVVTDGDKDLVSHLSASCKDLSAYNKLVV